MFAQRNRRYPEAAPIVDYFRDAAHPLDVEADLDPLIERVADARYVLLGEASHGTHEYYTWRAAISMRLIEEHECRFIAVEGDWPDCYRVNRYVKALDGRPSGSARDVLHAFERWPTWMWGNQEIVELVDWLRAYNDEVPEEEKVGFYGLDVYSLQDSLGAIVEYLERTDHEAADSARYAMQCFEPYGGDPQAYARSLMMVPESCEDEVVQLLMHMRETRPPAGASEGDREAHFDAEQNALVIHNAEHYYRTMIRGGPDSWNVRDRHMVATLERLMEFHGPGAKGVVWEHNTHVGDARFTDMAADGMVNVGQLVREAHSPEEVAIVGFGSHHGSVIAARAWEAHMRRMPVPDAMAGSVEDLMHRAGPENKLFLFDEAQIPGDLLDERGHRAIGVVYHPEFETPGNYVPSVLPKRYDSFLFIDRTHALRPLRLAPHVAEDVPETYPWGL